MSRRKTIRQEAIKTILEGKENRITVTMKPDNTPVIEIASLKPNPDKISFGKHFDGRNRLEFCAYRSQIGLEAFIYLNGERFKVDKYELRKLIGSSIKMGHYLGSIKKRKSKK